MLYYNRKIYSNSFVSYITKKHVMEMDETVTNVSIVTIDQNVDNNSDPSDVFRKQAFETVENILALLHSNEVKINVDLTQEIIEHNEGNEDKESPKNEQQNAHTLNTDYIENKDGNDQENQENVLVMNVDTSVKV